MATKTSGWKTVHSASITSQTDTTATIKVTGYWQNNGWTYDINYVSAWVYCGSNSKKVKDSGSIDATSSTTQKVSVGSYSFTVNKTTAAQSLSCYAKITSNSSYVSGTKSSTATTITVPAKTSYTIAYNANGGSGAPASQTKWYDTDLTLSSSKPTRTGYTFKGWATSASGTVVYAAGATYSANAAVTLYAVWTANTYTVSYNANGGSGAPSSQTKTYGVNLTLSSTKPTRTNYTFKGWATSASGTVVYAAGGTYSNNSAITLYAVWELTYVKPRITNFTAQRCDSTGEICEDGTYVLTTFKWATDLSVIAVVAEWKTQLASTWTSSTITASGTSGTVSQVVGDGQISNETSYIFRVYVQDQTEDGTTYSTQITLGTITFPIDIKKPGTGVAFGKAAEEDNLADFTYTVKLGGGLKPIFLEAETDLDDVRTPNFYTGENITNYNYSNCPLESGTFYLEVVSMGASGQVRQKISTCSKVYGLTYERVYFEGAWGSWRNCYTGEEVLYNDTSGSTDIITLSSDASLYQYLEIFYTDNNNVGCGYTKVFSPNSKILSLGFVEASSATTTYYKRTKYTISGTTITPNTTTAGYVKISSATASHSGGTNYIKITRVVGHR